MRVCKCKILKRLKVCKNVALGSGFGGKGLGWPRNCCFLLQALLFDFIFPLSFKGF